MEIGQHLAARSKYIGVSLPFVIGGLAGAAIQTADAQDTIPIPPLSEPIFERLLQSNDSGANLSKLDFARLPQPIQPPPNLSLNLDSLVLLPSDDTVTWLDNRFSQQVAPLNDRIAFRQELLEELLSDPNSNDNRIRQVQSILSRLRAERDRMAIEHLLLVRQLSSEGVLPKPPINIDLNSPGPTVILPPAAN